MPTKMHQLPKKIRESGIPPPKKKEGKQIKKRNFFFWPSSKRKLKQIVIEKFRVIDPWCDRATL